MTPRRPVLRYHGGKWRLAPWILSHMPRHQVYVEPYGGAASVLLRKWRSYAEIYNDLDDEVVNLFQVVRERGDELARAIELTPFARREYERSFEPSDDAVEQARRTVIRSLMGFGSNALCRDVRSGFRATSHRSNTTPSQDWRTYPDALRFTIDRLRGVVIEHRPAIDAMQYHDSTSTLHYCDPPYVPSTRSASRGHDYTHELTDADHAELAEALHRLRGMVMLSGYRCELYDGLYSDWRRVDRAVYADRQQARTESLWLSPRCVQHHHAPLLQAANR